MLEPTTTVLLIIDVQGNLAQAMDQKETLFANLTTLIRGAHVLELPIILTEQYPKGLGPTIPEIADLLPGIQPISKVAFSCCGEERFMQALTALNRSQVLVAGIEAHVCVYQTAADLLRRGYEVEIVTDAVSSRTASNRDTGLARMKDCGARLTSVEMALFELMKVAGGDQFKAIQKLVK
ncbi:MAG: hydrolase [Chloroflexaceae bacterium]|nr:hydrolase [Chloroflexaceae bacterium]